MKYLKAYALLMVVMTLLTACGAGGGGGTNVSVSDVGNVEGIVTDSSTSTALSGVTVQIGDKTATTGDNGVYSIQDLDVGTRTVTASKTGYQNHNGTCAVSKGTTVSHDIQLTANTSSDTTPPTVSSTSPANNATDIAVNSAITVTFSEAMDVSTITTSTFTLEQGTTPVSGTVTYSGTTATFTPSSNLSYSTAYTATLTTGAVDTAGNVMASSYSWSFTTGTAPDTTPPTVSSISPANNATDVAINSAITATFSETMDSSTVTTATFTLKQGTTAISGTVTYNGTTSTFTPSSNLSYSTTYTATITTGVKDAAGNAMTSDYSWSFTTGTAPDTTPPTVSSISPANNATDVAINSAITATFSETMDSSTVTTATFTLKQGTTPVSGTVTYTGTTATFTPSSNLAYSTTYTATITTGVKDAAGNAMASDYSWSFTTGTAPDTTPPTNTTASEFINGGATATTLNPATLSIAATDATGVTAYYASETSTTPSASDSGWTATTAATSYSTDVSYNLSSGGGAKTVYVWFKDAAGNVSASASDNITVIMGGAVQGTQLDLSGTVATFAGLASNSGSTDGTGTSARFNNPNQITTDGTNLFIAETSNHTIRKVVISTGVVTTLAGLAGYTGSTDGTGTAARFNWPDGITTDGTNLFVTESMNHTIRKIVISTGVVTTLAGSAGISGSADGTGTAARFNSPRFITTDGTNLFVAEHDNHTIRKIVISTGVVTTIAGSAGISGSTDGTGTAARFNTPYGITTDGTNLFITDLFNHTIRKMVISTGVVTTIAGSAGSSGSTDGTGTSARFFQPCGVTTDGTNLFISDYGNHTIRKVVISTSVVTTIAGSAGLVATTDGVGSAARFNYPRGITTDGTSLFETDYWGYTVRRIQ